MPFLTGQWVPFAPESAGQRARSVSRHDRTVAVRSTDPFGPFSYQARAQFTDAHNYDNTPVGTNQVELIYAQVRANASIDNSLVITGAKLNLYQGTVSYTRHFGVATV